MDDAGNFTSQVRCLTQALGCCIQAAMIVVSPRARPGSVAILSPHRDDAAFSCGIAMSLCLRRSIDLNIVNVFTVSSYAPFAPAGMSTRGISNLRRLEDEGLVRELGPGCHLHDLAEVDAPLRLNISEHEVTGDLSAEQFTQGVRRLAPSLQSLRKFDLILLPLALGNHVDHRIARDAACLAAASTPKAFYEDLPYAARLQGSREQTIQDQLRTLSPDPFDFVDLHIADAGNLKSRLALLYKSQIAPEVAQTISEYADTLGGAERIYATPNVALHLRETFTKPEPHDGTI